MERPRGRACPSGARDGQGRDPRRVRARGVAIRRLEKLGLVKRSRDPSDLRAVLVDITPRGLAVHRESLANRRAALANMLSELTEADLETLNLALVPLERLADQQIQQITKDRTS